MPFPPNLQPIINNEPVSADVVNRPLDALDARTQYLLALLQMSAIGSTLIARQVLIDPALVPGQPVYWNPANSRFEAALSTAVTGVSGVPAAADSAHVWGVVYQKDSANQADLLLAGYITLDISAALEPGQSLVAGLYYLSSSAPGTLTRAIPPVAMPVLRSDGLGNVYVNPAWEDPVTGHTHGEFLLRAAPAGTHTYPGDSNPHVITSPDPSVEGWLPAGHAVFGGKAPHRAVFGYNLQANKGLTAAWPPVPLSSVVLLQDGVQVQDGNSGLVIFDRNGIWWTSDAIGFVPFPDHIHTDPAIISEWSQPSDYDADTHTYEMQLKLYFTRPSFLTDQTAVTSLTSIDNRILVTCQGNPGQPATTGPLTLALELSFLVGSTAAAGYIAFKSFNPATQTFASGPVVSGVYAVSDNITLTGNLTETVVIDEVSYQVYRGDVGVNVDTGQGRELFVELTRLDGVEEEYVNDVMYLGFDPGKQQAIRARIPIPETLNLPSPVMVLKFRLIGLGAGTLPAMTLTYRRIPAPGALNTPVALPTSDSSLTLTISTTLTGANQFADVESAPFSILPGEDVMFTLQRGASDAYPYQVGVLRQVGLVTSA